MTRYLSIFFLLLAVSITPQAGAADPAPAPEAPILLRRCLLDYERSTQVGAIYVGGNMTVLQERLVNPGDRVKTDQVLGRLQNMDLLADMKMHEAEANNLLDIQLSENKHAQIALRVKRSEPLVSKSFISRVDFSILKLEEQQAALEIDKAKYTRSLAQLQYQQIAAQFRNRDFRSPYDGVVLEVNKTEGERITTADPVFLVVDDSKLLVTGMLDVADAWRVRKDQQVRILPDIDGVDLPVENEEFFGQIIFVDSRIDPSTRTCKVVARVPNRDSLLRSGLEVRMEILPASPLANMEPRREQPVRTGAPPRLLDPIPEDPEKLKTATRGEVRSTAVSQK